MLNKGLFTSNTNEWATPKEFYKELDKEFHFTLDVCATPENAKCKKFFTIKEIGRNICYVILLEAQINQILGGTVDGQKPDVHIS